MEQEKRILLNSKGSLMLESLIVYTITVFLLFFILAVFSVLYQRWNLQTIANETAARMAQTYRFADADDSSGYITDGQLVEVDPYRYLKNTITKGMESDVKNRITRYASWRLAKTTYTKNVTDPMFETEVLSDAKGRRHLRLTIRGEYTVPFGEAIAFFGFGSSIDYEVTAYADCLDIIDYINYVDFLKQQTNLGGLKSKVIGAIDSVISLVNNIIN